MFECPRMSWTSRTGTPRFFRSVAAVCRVWSTSHARSLHAEFTIFEGQTRVACWYRPVVKRLFWMGYPLELHSWLTPELEERIELSRRYDPGTLPKTVVLEPNYIATSAY
jgi:hypothetical protein